jgi:hypothetical protein
LLKNTSECFDRLSTNGKSSTISKAAPFALRFSKGERGIFQQPVTFVSFGRGGGKKIVGPDFSAFLIVLA